MVSAQSSEGGFADIGVLGEVSCGSIRVSSELLIFLLAPSAESAESGGGKGGWNGWPVLFLTQALSTSTKCTKLSSTI